MKLSSEQAITLSILGLGLTLLEAFVGTASALPFPLFPSSNIFFFQLGLGLLFYIPFRKVKFSLSVIFLSFCLYDRFCVPTGGIVQRVFVPLYATLAIVAFAAELLPIIIKKKEDTQK